jgi:rhodanese-related sulfurtransferase/membrane protein insertase Oxa1/YidC/SpoIIIJ/phosphohistidine swiveling domain-containing protein
VVINLFASLGQLLALLSLVAGGTAIKMRKAGVSQIGSGGMSSRRLLYATAGLMLASWVSFGLYFAYVQDLNNARLRANLLRASTEEGKAVGDSSLQTLSFSRQVSHPQGLSSEALRSALAGGQEFNLIDVRETEETESGAMPGSWHLRYPDLLRDRSGLIREGKSTVLICYSGNRSSELAQEFGAQSVPCQFLIGGYEKWIAEGGALVGGSDRRALRELPSAPNSHILIDTPEAITAVREQDVLFVDVRYPSDFAKGHLPGAINLPLRMLCTSEWQEQLDGLPDRPVMVPCYDKRSSFYASILGLRLHRAGRQFLGRYTVPHEYPPAHEERPYVAQWRAAQTGSTPFGAVKAWLAGALTWLQGLGGGLAMTILLLVVLLRGLLSPLTLKADLDQCRRQALGSRVAGLRRKFVADPVRAERVIVQLYKSAGLTPLRNLLVSVGQLVLFLAFFSVVADAAVGSTESLLGLWVLGLPDAFGTLPILIGALMAAIVCTGVISRRKIVLAIVLATLFIALTWQLLAAVNLYLVASLAWVVVQGRIAQRLAGMPSANRKMDASLATKGVVGLADAPQVASTGNKAIRLGQMLQAGLPVPDGFALTDKALQFTDKAGCFAEIDRQSIYQQHRRLGSIHVAVRSSGLKEDGGEKSYAGVFESVLEVKREGLFDAIDVVRSSMGSARARAYGDGDERGGIVVQAMVPAEHAGVMFTEHPGNTGSTLIELVDGLCEQLVGGAVTPKAFEFTRMSGQRISSQEPPVDLGPLLELGRQVEELFGLPQDIEWAYAKGKFYLLQARDVTARASTGDTGEACRQGERARLLRIAGPVDSKQVVFAQNEISELLPDPKPFSLSLMNALWAPGGSVDLACRSLGVSYNAVDGGADYVEAVFGKLYVNRIEEQRRLARGMSGLASFRLTRGADALEREFREDFQPGFHQRMRLLEVAEPKRLADEELFVLWTDVAKEFVTSTYVEVERINIAADFFMKSASEQLQRRGMNPAVALSDIPETVMRRAFACLPAIAAGQSPDEFMQLFGHRARHDFELSEKRYAEDSALVTRLAESGRSQNLPADGSLEDSLVAQIPRMLQLTVDRACRFQALKEDAKHQAARGLALLRSLTLEVGRRKKIGDKIFWLTLAEVEALVRDADCAAVQAIEGRMHARETFETLDLPVALTLEDLETMRLDDGPVLLRPDVLTKLSGKRVAGRTEVVGRVRVLRDAAEIGDFVEGEILVARFTDPTWSTVFPIAGGLVTEVGGWLSHAAILAREYDLACIVDVVGAGRQLMTGDVVRMGLDGSVERIPDAGLGSDDLGYVRDTKAGHVGGPGSSDSVSAG